MTDLLLRLRNWYAAADRFQARPRVVIVSAVLLIGIVIAAFGTLIATSNRIDSERQRLAVALEDQNLENGDEYALSLLERGTVTLDGVTYGEARLAERPELIFNEAGSIEFPIGLAEVLVRDRYPTWAPRWLVEQPGTTWLLGIAAAIVAAIVVLTGSVLSLILVAAGTTAAMLIATAIGADEYLWSILAAGVMGFIAFTLLRGVLVMLDRPNQLCGIAHTVVREATRTKLPLIFIVTLLILLPLIPMSLDEATPLRYKVQNTIASSIRTTYYMCASMTLFLACATVAFEIRDRQIWQLMTKPVHRARYLLGKWLGLVLVNAVILSVASVSIFGFIQYLRMQPVASGLQGQEDRQLLRHTVLTARVGGFPDYVTLDREQVRARVQQRKESDPELSAFEDLPPREWNRLAKEIGDQFDAGQRSIPPGQQREYVFSGLGHARDSDGVLTLRYRFHILDDSEHDTYRARFVVEGPDGPEYFDRTYVPTVAHIVSLPPTLIDDEGNLRISVGNMLTQQEMQAQGKIGSGALNWERSDFELLVPASTFEANFFRSMFVALIKLSFLAMLGLTCGTFLSFPVACLFAFTIFIAGTMGPFLAGAIAYYKNVAPEAVDWSNPGQAIIFIFRSFVRIVAFGIVFMLEEFGRINPAERLVEGRLVSWRAVGNSLAVIGGVWTGIALLVGWGVLRRRQLAIYSGHG